MAFVAAAPALMGAVGALGAGAAGAAAMGGGKGGGGSNQTTSVNLDPRLVEGSVQAMAGAMRSASLPYRPNRGVTDAAFTPEQMAAFEGANMASMAYGLPAPSGPSTYLPQPEQNAAGFWGYSPSASYDDNISRSLSEEDIAQRNALLDSYAASAKKISPYAPFDSLRIPDDVPNPVVRQAYEGRMSKEDAGRLYMNWEREGGPPPYLPGWGFADKLFVNNFRRGLD